MSVTPRGPTRVAGRLADDEGSILPLLLGYLVLAISVVFVCACATDLYIAQKRLDSLADAAALAGADGFEVVVLDDAVRAELADAGVREQAAAIVAVGGEGAELVDAHAPDSLTARVTVAALWHPPLVSFLLPEGVHLRATASSRTALH